MSEIQTPSAKTLTVKILGPGCANCRRLEANTRSAVEQLHVSAVIEKVEDIGDIMSYGIMRTPGLIVDDQVVISGRVPSIPEIVTLLTDRL